MKRSTAIKQIRSVLYNRERYAATHRAEPQFYAQTEAIRWALAALQEMPAGWRPDVVKVGEGFGGPHQGFDDVR